MPCAVQSALCRSPDLSVRGTAGSGIGAAHGVLTSELFVEFDVGDCVETTHTNSTDVWHGTFIFMASAGNTLGQSPRLDGLPMSIVGKVYSWTIPSRVTINSTNFALIRKITWRGRMLTRAKGTL